MRPFVTYPMPSRPSQRLISPRRPNRWPPCTALSSRWDVTFPATIGARVIETGDNWQQVEVAHRMNGRVPNALIFLSDTEIELRSEEAVRRQFSEPVRAGRGGRHALRHKRPDPPQGPLRRPETVLNGLRPPAGAPADADIRARTPESGC